MSEIFSIAKLSRYGYLMPGPIADLTNEQIADLSNGCGPQSMKFRLIPNSIAGVEFKAACDIHDCCYHFGVDEEDKRIADRAFLFNLLVSIDHHCEANGIIDRMQRVACREAAFDYYKAVSYWGGEAFYAGKDKS